jgi:hypothetical protein
MSDVGYGNAVVSIQISLIQKRMGNLAQID